MLETNKEKLIALGKNVEAAWLEDKLAYCVTQTEKNMLRFKEKFPSASATNGIYRIKENDDWTNGFWTGMLWLSYQLTTDKKFYLLAKQNLISFQQRLADHFVLDHHDIGFLYSLSAGADYKITGDPRAKKIFLEAADVLAQRFQPKGNFIQAWGRYGEADEYRLIIDSLINLPLLFEASQISGNSQYAEIAEKHYQTLLNTVIKPDGTTYHTYYFDPKTGQPTYGATHQGNQDDSIWARGQSWGVLGIPLNENFRESQPFPQIYSKIVDAFLENLPADLIPYWDFDFTDQLPAEKDSSALAIAAVGLLEAEKLNAYSDALAIAKGMVYQLGEHYTAENFPENEGILLHGVYAYHQGKGIDEPNLWGDYFYFESLMRLSNKEWQPYW
ncbi:glycoside hydrolase family 88 protein [Enterococcus sp. LJL90]